MDDRRGPRRKVGARMKIDPANMTRARTNRRKGDDGATLEDWVETVWGKCGIMQLAELWEGITVDYESIVVDKDVVKWLRKRFPVQWKLDMSSSVTRVRWRGSLSATRRSSLALTLIYIYSTVLNIISALRPLHTSQLPLHEHHSYPYI